MKKWSKRREKAQSLFKNGRYNDAAIIFEKCVEQARTFPKVAINKGLLYCCLCQLGNCWYKLCKYDVAIPLFKESMEGVFESAGDECELYSEVLLLFSKCLLKTDRLTEAQNTLESALKLKRTERNGQNRFEFLMLLVDVAIARKEYTEAIDNLEKAEFIVSTILKDDLLLADVLSVMIISYSGMEDYSLALEYAHRSLELTRKYANISFTQALTNLALIYAVLRYWDNAIYLTQEAYNLCVKILGPNADYTLFSKEMLEQLSRVRHDPSFVPTSFGVSSKRICRVCEKIGTVLEILQCVRCKRAYYCGVECQAKDFPSHKETCIRACFTCEKIPDDIMVCTACNDAVYCNAECQLVDWSRHKSECSNPETLVSVLNPVA